MKNFQTTAYLFSFAKQPRIFAKLGTAMLIFSTFFLTGAVDSIKGQAAQNVVSGEWTAEFDKPGKIQFTFHRRSDQGSFSMTSETFSPGELQGLNANAASSAPKASVNFSIVREAGTFSCEGYFSEGRGAGFWKFSPNPNFVSMMRGRGYDNLTGEDLLRAASHNLTNKSIEGLKSSGYDRLEFNQLLRAVSHNITPEFIGEMQTAGYENLKMDELIRARNHDIDGEYIKEVRAMGFGKQPLETLIRLRNHEITRDFINRMRSAGFANLSAERLITLKNHEITPEFVNGLKAEGYSGISAETAVRLKNRGIDRDFIQRVKARGFNNLTLEQIIRLRSEDIVK